MLTALLAGQVGDLHLDVLVAHLFGNTCGNRMGMSVEWNGYGAAVSAAPARLARWMQG